MIAIALALLAFAAQTPAAPQTKPAQQPSTSPAPRSISDAELTQRLDAYAIEQAQKALELTPSQYKAFAPRLRRYQETRRRNVEARNKVLLQLRQLTAKGRGAAEGDIRAALKSLREQEDRAVAELKRAYADLDEVLDIRQQARFRIFEQAIDRRKLDLLRGARDGGRTGAR
jgi:hypothetical protein